MSHRLLLVTDDRPLAEALQTHLYKTLGQRALLSTYDTILDQLVTEPIQVLLLLASSAADVEQIRPLVEELLPRSRPLAIVIVASEAVLARQAELSGLDRHVAGRFLWPEQAFPLAELVRKRLGQTRHRTARKEEVLHELIRRRLSVETPALACMAEALALAAAHDVPVLLTGETGTGKTYLARLIHEYSARRNQSLVVVPCGSLVTNLLESELFGHVKGAFTGADRHKVGKFEAVGAGTLLLDEIDSLGLDQQARLLRVIETGDYEAVGSNQVRKCAARFIIASNWDLEDAMAQGKFRSDLYYRLNVMAFYLPPLRERTGDILPLALAMVARFSEKFQRDMTGISEEAQAALQAFPWPGNIRQLENVIQRAVLLGRGPELLAQHLPQTLRDASSIGPGAHPAETDSLLENRRSLERIVIQRALAHNGYSRARTANALGVSRVTLYKKMKQYGLMDVPRQTAQAV